MLMDKTKIEATLLAQEIWKNPDVVGPVTINGLVYSLTHGQVVKLDNDQTDITKLPSIEFSIVKAKVSQEHVKSGDVYVKLRYSGEIVSAYGDITEDNRTSRFNLSPEEALKVATEVWNTVRNNTINASG